MSMDVGTNQHGYRWVVEDQRELGKGYAVRVWGDREDLPTTTAARSGFSTREAAASWAGEFEGGDDGRDWKGILVVASVGAVFVAIFAASLVRLATTPIRIGTVRETTRDLGHGPGRARPLPR